MEKIESKRNGEKQRKMKNKDGEQRTFEKGEMEKEEKMKTEK